MTEADRTALTLKLQQALPQLSGIATADSDRFAARLALYLSELEKWNRAYNLTAVRDTAAMLPRHIYDSLSVLPQLQGSRVLDVGTGAGLPGIPLAICQPGTRFTLLDSNGKKVRFLRHVTGMLALPNVDVVQARVETWTTALPFDTVLCRAFTSLADFVRSCAHLCAADGVLLAMKGKYPQDEIAALPSGWQLRSATSVQVHQLEGERHIVQLRRTEAAP